MEEWLLRANTLREHKSFDETMKFLLTVLQECPRDPRVYFQMGFTHEAMGSELDAAHAYERALQLGLTGPDLMHACLSLGNIYRAHGRLEDSKYALNQGISRFPTYRPYYAYLALTLHDLGDHSQAMKLLLDLVVDCTNDPGLRQHEHALSYYALRLGAKGE